MAKAEPSGGGQPNPIEEHRRELQEIAESDLRVARIARAALDSITDD